MAVDITEAIKAPYVKCPKMNFVHWILGAILMFIPIANFIILGAMAKWIGYVRKGQEAEFSLMEDMGDSFGVGLKMILGGILLCLPIMLIGAIAAMLSSDSSSAGLIFVLVYILVYLLYLVFGFALMANFSLDYKVMSFVDFKRAFFLIKADVKSYIMTVLFTLVISIAYSILTIIPLVGFIVLLVVVVPYMMGIYHLVGQFLKENKAVPVLNNVYHFE